MTPHLSFVSHTHLYLLPRSSPAHNFRFRQLAFRLGCFNTHTLYVAHLSFPACLPIYHHYCLSHVICPTPKPIVWPYRLIGMTFKPHHPIQLWTPLVPCSPHLRALVTTEALVYLPSLGANPYLPTGYVLSTWWVLKQNTQHKPTRSILITFVICPQFTHSNTHQVHVEYFQKVPTTEPTEGGLDLPTGSILIIFTFCPHFAHPDTHRAHVEYFYKVPTQVPADC